MPSTYLLQYWTGPFKSSFVQTLFILHLFGVWHSFPSCTPDPLHVESSHAGMRVYCWCILQIVANGLTGIDVDKMDYFARDSHGLGLPNRFDWRCVNEWTMCKLRPVMEMYMHAHGSSMQSTPEPHVIKLFENHKEPACPCIANKYCGMHTMCTKCVWICMHAHNNLNISSIQ